MHNAAKSDDEAIYLVERQDGWEAAVRADAGLSRREVLKLAAAGTLFAAGAGALLPGSGFAQASVPGPVPGILKNQLPDLLIPRGTNSEMQWASMRRAGHRTPIDRFFVRNHTTTPRIDPATWQLSLYGDGLSGAPSAAAPVRFSLRDLERLEPFELSATVECAGNGRSFYGTQQGQAAAGTAWTLGAVGLATWRGVRLADVLERAGLLGSAVDVMPIGLDDEVSGPDKRSQGHVRRPLPIKKALHDVMIALEMNGRTLPADHGFPARLVVPGWVGIASTKWLGAIEVARHPLYSPWNTTSYRLAGEGYPADSPPLTANPMKSAFELPLGAVLPAGKRRTLSGRSWSGRYRPTQVEVSTDGGASWRRARLHGPNEKHGWVRWDVDWTPRAAGATQLLARATDARGKTQPDATRFNRDGYWFDAVVEHPVTIA